MPAEVKQFAAMLPYALAYARRGWPVFPLHTPIEGGGCSCGKLCGTPGKHPRTRRGFKEATTDEETIRNWWRQWPQANIGIATGETSGILAVDIDPKNGGAGTWSRIQIDNDMGPLTISVNTGSGGWHHYYQRPTDRGVVKSKANAIKPGIDTRCDGGYVVAPPSLHVSGARYSFREGADPADAELQPCPPWLLALLYPQPGPTPPPKPLPGTTTPTDGWLLTAFRAANWIRRDLGPDRVAVRCPWEETHSHPAGDSDSSTVVFRPTAGRSMGHFHCSHAHCSDRTLDEVRAALPPEAVAAANTAYPPRAEEPVSDPELESGRDPNWQANLSRKPNGDLHPIVSNAIAILTNDEQWRGVLAHDAFASRSIFRAPPPWYADDAPALPHTDLEDDDDVRLVSWMERRYSLRISKETAHAALELVCQRHAFHPVRDYLRTCRDLWDGKMRLPTFSRDYLGATDSDAHSAVAPLRWFICAVRRIHEPGCQADSILVFEGDQGLGKSKGLRALFSDPWFADDLGDPANKDSADALRGKWCVEIGELRWRKSDEETRKAFISRRVDHYRPAYARRTIDVPRQCVLAASTNEHDWQTDPTGARRYWAVPCGRIDDAAIARDRNQLWAEAMVRYEAGEPSWLQDDEVPAQVAALNQRREVDPWEPKIMDWMVLRVEVTIEELLTQCLGFPIEKQSNNEARRAGRVLRANGWRPMRHLGPRGARVKVWGRAPEPSGAQKCTQGAQESEQTL